MDNESTLRAQLFDALLAGLCGLIVFGPIMGLVLDGYTVDSHWQRPFMAAGIVFVGRFLYLSVWRRLNLGFRSKGAPPNVDHSTRESRRIRLLAISFVIATAAVLPFFSGKYWLTVFILTLIYVLLGLGLNIVVGLAGLLDLGFVAFYAVGAYSYALGAQYLDIGFWAALPMGAFLAAAFGVVLAFPVLRMHGDYLAIVTLGFGEIIRLVLNNWLEFTGGPNGVAAPFPTVFGLEFTRWAKQGGTPFHEYFGLEYSTSYKYLFLYFLLLLVCIGLVYFVHRLKQMPMGRAWEALREDEIACRSLGINHVAVKLSAFAMGAMVGGIAGVFFAAFQGFINPTSFTFFESALILAVVVLGGMGSIPGVITAAVVLTLLPEILREFADFRILIFGVLMVLMMIWRPRGLLRSKRPAFKMGGV